jgi:hypothetical protein
MNLEFQSTNDSLLKRQVSPGFKTSIDSFSLEQGVAALTLKSDYRVTLEPEI